MDLAENVDPSHTALVVIDMQCDYFCKGGIIDLMGHDYEANRTILPALKRFTEASRKYLKTIIFTRQTMFPYLRSPVVVEHYTRAKVTKVVDSFSLAQKLEGKLKAQSIEERLLGVSQSPLIDEIWQEYLDWIKINKKSWKDDLSRWEHHIEPVLKGKGMDSIIPLDVHDIVANMKRSREYAPATIRQVIVLVKRLYNWASEMGL